MNDIEQNREPVGGNESGLSTAALAGAEPQEGVRPEERAFGPRDDTAGPDGEKPAPLYSSEEAQRLRGQWADVQASFVDEPRRAVEQADNLVAVALKHLAETFAKERSSLEGQWDRGDDVSTEDLRLVLRKYRSFFDRLLEI